MSTLQPYRPLQVVLYAISAIEGLAGLVLLFATGWVLSFAPALLTLAYTGFVVMLVKGIGIIALAVGYLACVTARSPARYVAVIDMLVFLLVAAAALNLYAAVALHLGVLYPSPYLIVRAAIQLILAVVLLALRRKAVPA